MHFLLGTYLEWIAFSIRRDAPFKVEQYRGQDSKVTGYWYR